MKELLLTVAALGCFASSLFAQEWSPNPATPTTTISRDGSVAIGTTNSTTSAGASKLVVSQTASGGTVNIAVENKASYDSRANIYFITGPDNSTERNLGYIGAEGITKSLILRNLISGNVQVQTNGSGGSSALVVDNNASFDSRAQVQFFAGPNNATNRKIGYIGAEAITGNLVLQNTGPGGIDLLTPNQSGKITMLGDVIVGTPASNGTQGTYKLNVWGRARANEIIVNTTGADFVFAKTYKLRPLFEVEQYIKQNQHLPEIPSAAEMQENGMAVGELQTKLLQKVEELTLYLIEQNKQLQELNKKNEKQSQTIKALQEQLSQSKK